MARKKHLGSRLAFATLALFTLICVFLALTLRWSLSEWDSLTLDEIVIQLSLSVGGTSQHILESFFFQCGLPAAAITLVLMLLTLLPNNAQNRRRFRQALCALCAALLGVCFAIAWVRFDAAAFFRRDYSTFVDDNYAAPDKTAMAFPEKKRNLVYIYLESMETTFANVESGGAFPYNCIPELTRLAMENEDFSGDDPALNGGFSLVGSGWTMGAMVSQTSGLPMKFVSNNMNTQSAFFPGTRNLGDVLKANGYRQVVMFGSDGAFGGRDKLFSGHGQFEVKDLAYAREMGWIDPDYAVWWGYEDEKLFQFAREELLRLSQGGEPFNLTLLTADTHFPDGYVCPLCGDEFGDNQYANVLACSSRQVDAFVRWIQQQDFYENTTIVLSGDHPTMDGDFCDEIAPDYTRKTFTAFINAPVSPALNRRRQFATIDLFPTTLRALGVAIEGDRLGLGTDLFSAAPTLSELYGYDDLNSKISARSRLMDKLQSVSITQDMIDALIQMRYVLLNDSGQIKVIPVGAEEPIFNLDSVFIECWSDDSAYREQFKCDYVDGLYCAMLDEAMVREQPLHLKVVGHTADKSVLTLCNADLTTDVMKRSSFEYFLRSTAKTDEIVLLGICDEGSNGLTEYEHDAMRAFGLQADLHNAHRHSYLAVRDGGILELGPSAEPLERSGTLSTGSEYRIRSAGYEAGNLCEIWIDGVDYSPHGRGMNLVVVDSATGMIRQSYHFDTYLTPEQRP